MLNKYENEIFVGLKSPVSTSIFRIFQVSITVIDVNDESPEFQFMVYKGQIEENLPQGSPVVEVKAIDGDDQNMVSCS
jgi:hypothetical protein